MIARNFYLLCHVHLWLDIAVRKYQDSNGNNRTSWSVVASNVQILKDGQTLEREEGFIQHSEKHAEPYEAHTPEYL